jgi:hypothetical protein
MAAIMIIADNECVGLLDVVGYSGRIRGLKGYFFMLKL